MGSSPIARSIFILFLLLGILSAPISLLAQVTTDPTLPFDEGEVVLLPSTTAYLGDLPHFIDLVPNDAPFHTLGGIQVPLAGWIDPLGQNSIGLHSTSPGVFFENIPYPLASSSLNSLPASGTAQILNFPAQAWLGPSSASGAINLTAPMIQESASERASVWGGTGTTLGIDDQFVSHLLGADLDYRHGNSVSFSQTDQFNLISKESWVQSNAFNVGTGFLGTQGLGNDHWYSSYAELSLLSPNFQTLQFKPYFQSAQSGSQTVQDAGGFLNYLFNLAGLAESHLGLGFDSDSGTGISSANTGFLQSTNLVDVLGDVSLDAAFRWDFSSVGNTTFSTVLGLQGKFDDWTALGDYDKGVSPWFQQNVQQSDVGFRFQPNDTWSMTVKYVYEQLGESSYNGGDLRVQLNEFDGFGLVRKFQFDAEERTLVLLNGAILYDTGLTGKLSLTSQDHEWVTGRCVSNEAVFLEAGIDYAFSKELKAYGSFANITGIPSPLPDLDVPNGVVASVGVQFSAN